MTTNETRADPADFHQVLPSELVPIEEAERLGLLADDWLDEAAVSPDEED